MIQVTSEIGTLRKVMLHRPGDELLNLTPDVLEELLFDDIPALQAAQAEHDVFAQMLRDQGVEVLYLTDLMVETLEGAPAIRAQFIDQFLTESGIHALNKQYLTHYFAQLDTRTLVEKTMAGISKSELETLGIPFHSDKELLSDSPLALYPMPNLYFTRDPFANVGKTTSINAMYTHTRHRETLYGHYIFQHHPTYHSKQVMNHRLRDYHIEGGDILVLSEQVLAIGISQRTDLNAVKQFALDLFTQEGHHFTHILAITIPNRRTFMHLDTVFTQVDIGAFVIHPEILTDIVIQDLSLQEDQLICQILEQPLEVILANYLGRSIELINCGGDDIIASQREQWSDGANTLAIAPKKLVVYQRNVVTNNLLKSKGYELLELNASNLGVGRGGPRCMSMPFERDALF